MISQYDVKQFAEKNADKCWFSVDKDNNVVDKEDNKIVCSLKTLTELLRRETHCDFETIYECHGLLQVVLRCKECGAVIFASDDEWYYESDLRCPVCSDYKTGFKYWSSEDIKNDVEKQKEIDFLMEMQREQIEEDKRYMKRKKYDWQIWEGRIELPKRAIYFDLECDNLFKTKLKGLRLIIHWAHKDDIGYIYKKHFRIPLSWSALKISIMIWRKDVEKAEAKAKLEEDKNG